MVRLDVGTLAFSAAITALVAAVVILTFGDSRRGDRRWGPFSLSSALYGVGVLLVLAADPVPKSVAILGGNLLVVLSAIAAHVGACLLAGRRVVPYAYGVLIALFVVGEVYFLTEMDSVNARIAAVSLVRVPLFVHAALILVAPPPAGAGTVTRSPMIAGVLGGWALLLALRGVGALTDGPIHDFVALQGMQAFYFVAAALGNLMVAIALLRMDGAMVQSTLAAEVARQTAALESRIAQHDAARRVIRSQLALRDALIDTLPNPVFAKDTQGRFLACNGAFERDLGISRTALIGKTSLDVHDSDQAIVHLAADQKVLAADGPHVYEGHVRYADGTLHRVLFNKARFRDSDGAVAGVVGAMTDITELSRVTEDLRRSEADLRAILDNMTDVFYRSNAEGRVTMVSRSVEETFGYTVDEALGLPSSIALIGDFRSTMIATLEANGGAVRDYEFQMRHKNGQVLWVSASTRLRRDSLGRFLGTEGTVRLIEDRKRAEAALYDSQSLIQALIDCSADATALFDADGTLLACNAVLADRFGRTVDQIVGTNLWTLFPPDIAARHRAETLEVMENGFPKRVVERRDGRVHDIVFHPVANVGGHYTRVAVLSRDITDQSEAEARIARHMAEVERSNAELEQFAYVASHDLREPLRMICSYLSLIERRYAGCLDRDGRDFLAFAREGARRMDHLVLDLLDYARIERGGQPIVACPVLPALTQAIRDLGPAIAESGGRVLVEAAQEPPVVMADGGQVARLFQNLIGNALKYRTPDRPPEIRVSARRLDGMWQFDVADNGIGIEPVYYERIFRIFQRLHTQDRYEGTGIGLAICKRIVDRHGGQIWVRSDSGQGSVFSFTLRDADAVSDPAEG